MVKHVAESVCYLLNFEVKVEIEEYVFKLTK